MCRQRSPAVTCHGLARAWHPQRSAVPLLCGKQPTQRSFSAGARLVFCWQDMMRIAVMPARVIEHGTRANCAQCMDPACCASCRLKSFQPSATVALQVIDQGLAFYWGTSEWSAAQIEEAWQVAQRLDLIGPGGSASAAGVPAWRQLAALG